MHTQHPSQHCRLAGRLLAPAGSAESSPALSTPMPSTATVPDETWLPRKLLDAPQWVLWEFQCRNAQTWAKVPLNPATFRAGSVIDAANRMTFAAAHLLACGRPGTGLGFVFVKSGPFIGIDLDNCIDEHGVLHPGAEAIINACGSYAEVSPIGRGIKMFATGTKPAGMKCVEHRMAWGDQLEVYEEGRYFTVTGKHLGGTPLAINDAQVEINRLAQEYWPAPEVHSAMARGMPTLLADAALIDRAAKARNGHAFTRLMNGNSSMHGGDHSTADLALCGLLAFWSGGDEEQIDRIFRTCALYRSKWDEMRGDRTYGQRTIDKALSGRTRFFTNKKASA